MFKLQGKWNSHLDAFKCGADGEPLQGEEALRLWTVRGQAVWPVRGPLPLGRSCTSRGACRLPSSRGRSLGGPLRRYAACLSSAAGPRPLPPCRAAHSILPAALAQCTEKPADDPYGFTHFAHTLNSCAGGINPLPSDSRRRPDRALLELGSSSGAGWGWGLRKGEGDSSWSCSVSRLGLLWLQPCPRLSVGALGCCTLAHPHLPLLFVPQKRPWPSTTLRRCSGRSARWKRPAARTGPLKAAEA